MGVAFSGEFEWFTTPGGNGGIGGGCSCKISPERANEGVDNEGLGVFSVVDLRSPPSFCPGAAPKDPRVADIDGARRILLINLVPNPEVIGDAELVAGKSRDWGIDADMGTVTASSGSEWCNGMGEGIMGGGRWL